MSHKLLLVDDEADTLEFLSYNLNKEGFEVFTAQNGKAAIDLALKEKPHLILLDVMMPEMDGMETCEKLRNYNELNNTIIAFLTARGEDYSQIAGFEVGADDYITKPIKPKVLVSRVKALLKRVSMGTTIEKDCASSNSLVIDKERFMVIRNGEEIMLRRKEFELLMLLYSNPQKVFTREEIFSAVWGDDIVVGERTIDVHIRKLREKIGDNYIRTHKGFGYMFVRG
ncbi:MAG: response regulator transcription factor [Prevotellaceae bacterium]|jgi:two-component system alkaline phosphatase synthesis response regulator PhoP|nr:response regulator transcription factor [Prevotellaceae bacterium]